jgi:carboxymethylenebutenolidase
VTKTIELKTSDGHTLGAYVAEPTGKARGLVVVIQEIFGVNSHIRSVADGYAAAGYLAVAPAMFDRVQPGFESGYTQPEVAAGVEIMKKLDWDKALLDVKAVLDWGKSSGKAGIVGYCWGGVVAWLAATRLSGLSAASSYYGGSLPSFVNEKPACPVMFHFGELDQSITVDKAREVAAAHPEAQTFYYPAGHGFNCDQRGSYDEKSSKLALQRTLDFFAENLA